jgi:hypothetical protein
VTTVYTCSRCAGTGRFSFNLMHGTKCYGCNGTGKQKTKPRAPTPKWAVFGQHRATGQWLRLYNVGAKTKAMAIDRALRTYQGASPAWQADYDLNPATARAIKWADMADQQATTWAEAAGTKEAA